MIRLGQISVLPWILITSSCGQGDGPPDVQKEFPDPIEIIEGGRPDNPSEEAESEDVPDRYSAYAEFECAAGAPVSTQQLESQQTERIENGETVQVIYYDPTGVLVFGLEAKGLERYVLSNGRPGVAAYVAEPPVDIRRAIGNRYPSATFNNGRVFDVGMGGALRLEDASDGLTRIVCERGVPD